MTSAAPELRSVVYAGDLDTAHTKAYVAFLEEHVPDVSVISIEDLARTDTRTADVLIVDAAPMVTDPVDGHQTWRKAPLGLALEHFPIPTVLVGTFGVNVGDALNLKLGGLYGCWCLDEDAIVWDPTHAVFGGVAPVTVDTPSPESFLSYAGILDVPASVPTLKVLADPQPTAGQVTSPISFLDSPDCELIAGGINTKTHGHFAIGRQASFLQWGFAGTPDEYTPAGRDLLLGCIRYIAGFRGQPVEQFRTTRPRLGLQGELANDIDWESLAARLPEDRLATFRKAYESRMFGENDAAPARGDLATRLAWYAEHEPYLTYAGTVALGHWEVDEDLQSLGIANSDPQLLVTCLATPDERAARLWARYVGRSLDDPARELAWFETNRDNLYFTDWGGFRWVSSLAPPTPIAPTSPPVGDDIVQAGMTAMRTGDATQVRILLTVAPPYYTYAPGAEDGLPLGVTLAADSAYTVESPLRSRSDRSHLSGANQLTLSLVGGSETDDICLSLRVQVCDNQTCLPPRSLSLTCTVAGR